MTLATSKTIFENFRKFEVDFSTNGADLNLASIKENGKEVWSIFASTEKKMRSQVTKWVKENW